ncbi:cytochrome P450, partial [Mollisia scopiformis]
GSGVSGKYPIPFQPCDEIDMALSMMHTDPEIWGEDAEPFRPERWYGLKQSWDFIPFSGGRRICLAQQNVLTDISYVLTRLMLEFRPCENLDECLEYIEGRVFTPQSKNGIQVALIAAQ